MQFSIKETNNIYAPLYGLWVDGLLVAADDDIHNLVRIVDRLSRSGSDSVPIKAQ